MNKKIVKIGMCASKLMTIKIYKINNTFVSSSITHFVSIMYIPWVKWEYFVSQISPDLFTVVFR